MLIIIDGDKLEMVLSFSMNVKIVVTQNKHEEQTLSLMSKRQASLHSHMAMSMINDIKLMLNDK